MSIFAFPLADLHRHLDGSLRPSTLCELATAKGFEPPDLDKLRFPSQYADGERRMGLAAALERFSYTLSLLDTPDAVRRVASEICEDAQADGVTTLEIRFAPQLHDNSVPMEAYVEAAIEGANGRAGIILCGLHGEPPSVLDRLVEMAVPRKGVVGIDIAGCPTPHHIYGVRDYVPAFRRAEEHGIGRTVHAGEGGPTSEIRDAIELLHAQRIGHGTTLSFDQRVLELAVEKDILFEVCPTSNYQTGVIAAWEAHKLCAWLAQGVKAVLCPDNTFFSNVTSAEENENAILCASGLGHSDIKKMAAWGHAAAFKR